MYFKKENVWNISSITILQIKYIFQRPTKNLFLLSNILSEKV